MRCFKSLVIIFILMSLFFVSVGLSDESPAVAESPDPSFTSLLDAPLLFIKRYSYTGIHIYDTFYKWPANDKGNGAGIGGIYILENPSAPHDKWNIRTVIDGTSEGTLGNGVYSHPDISYDCSKIIFCYKAAPTANTMIYEINIDGSGLRCLTDPSPYLAAYKGVENGIHDLSPTYLPDGRIVFLSTRPSGLVPCANKGVSILHVMNADGSGIHPISVNSETEFDPMVLPDGRIIYGRWEYIDKTALTVQSVWTIYPDGSNETAMYGNNMVFPEAILDPRPVPGTALIAATLSKHNSTPRGTIAMINPFVGKNDPAAIYNFENKDDPTHDRGNSCEPYPINKDVMIYSGRPEGSNRNCIMMINRKGERTILLSDPKISLHAPMLINPHSSRILPAMTDRSNKTGKFYVQNVYEGLKGVQSGEAKWLRIIEESSRVSTSPGGNIFNQTFSISAALAFSAKIYHGMVPIHEDGSIYFEVPSGRAIFFQVLDKDKRLIQSMRTFIQAAPGATRSCIGCHETKSNAPASLKPIQNTLALIKGPSAPQPESWGSGYMDYSTLIQPIWNKNCVTCHGGEKNFSGRLDLTGGWTEYFNNSYENLVDRRHTQLVPYYIAGIDCMNGTAHYSVPLFPPKSFGSAVAPLAKVIASGHKGRIKNLTRAERDLIMAWIDSNGLYFGTWDYTKSGPRLVAWRQTRDKLAKVMDKSNCWQRLWISLTATVVMISILPATGSTWKSRSLAESCEHLW
ncbi:MAG: HzsA-related protein [Planctomycetota bacterium]